MSIVEKVNALLAKAESTDSAEEAQAYFAKAEELMLKHAIEEAELEAARPGQVRREEIVKMYVGYNGPKGFWLHLGRVGTAIVVGSIGRVKLAYRNDGMVHAVVGPKSEVEYVTRMLPLIWTAAYRSLRQARILAGWTYWDKNSKWDFDRGYLVGFCQGIADQISEKRRTVEEKHGTALALLDRSAEIDAVMGATRAGRPVKVSSLGAVSGYEDGYTHTLAAGEVGR